MRICEYIKNHCTNQFYGGKKREYLILLNICHLPMYIEVLTRNCDSTANCGIIVVKYCE